MTETYDGLEWDIDEFPIGSSTPDEFFELDFRAKAKCPECGNTINGTAHFWSRDEDMSMSWLDRVDYEPCEECEDENKEEEEFDDEQI